MSHSTLSDLDIIRASEPAKIRKLIRNGMINPTIKNIQGQDLLVQALLQDVPAIQIRAILSGAQSIQKKVDIKTAMRMLNQESIRVLGICNHNLTHPRMTKETKKMLSQLFLLAHISPANQYAFSPTLVVLKKVKKQKEIRPTKPKCIVARKHPKCEGMNLAWAMV